MTRSKKLRKILQRTDPGQDLFAQLMRYIPVELVYQRNPGYDSIQSWQKLLQRADPGQDLFDQLMRLQWPPRARKKQILPLDPYISHTLYFPYISHTFCSFSKDKDDRYFNCSHGQWVSSRQLVKDGLNEEKRII